MIDKKFLENVAYYLAVMINYADDGVINELDDMINYADGGFIKQYFKDLKNAKNILKELNKYLKK